jgi:hypothetical protein
LSAVRDSTVTVAKVTERQSQRSLPAGRRALLGAGDSSGAYKKTCSPMLTISSRRLN